MHHINLYHFHKINLSWKLKWVFHHLYRWYLNLVEVNGRSCPTFRIRFAKAQNNKHYANGIVTTITLGSWPRQGFTRVVGQEGSRESHNILPGVWEGVREWTLTPQGSPTLGVGVLVDFESSEGNCRGQNSMAWRIIYINGKRLERRYLKWVHIAHLDIWNTNYGQKKGRESNW
jgi:hypothetical protein